MSINKQQRIIDLRAILNNPDSAADKDAVVKQLENFLPKPTKTLYIDADSLVFYTALSPRNVTNVKSIEGGTFIGIPVKEDYEYLQVAFYSLVDTVVAACRLESLKGNMIRFKDYKLVFTPSTNFRYDIYPKYKIKRLDKERTDELIYLRNWSKSIGLIVEGVEADDVVAHYGRRGHPIASGDKDVIYGVEGSNYFYHSAHRKVVHTTKEDADLFVLLQTLAGDSGDDIPGLEGIGLKIEKGVIKAPRAMKLLSDKPCFNDVIEAYISKGRTKEDAILTRRLVGMDQWKGFRRGLKLWKSK